jgi:dihydrofolate synthase/folylpolyglutamate synthase
VRGAWRAYAAGVPIAPDAAAIQAWLDSSVNHERDGTFREIRLDRIARFLRELPPPPAPLTIAGTKGKGSVARLAEAALRAQGHPTLAFTSPHVASVLERWRLDGEPAPAAAVAEACERVADLERRLDDRLTYFERTFAAAVLLAARPGTAFVCEVGLGGRLDCANAVDCAVATLTHLSHDHRDVLGPTLAHIAREKLAVARSGRPLVIAPQSPAAERAIRAELPRGVEARWIAEPREPFALAMPGAHQQGNAATALAAAALYRPGLDEATARGAMAAARLAARCQLVERGGRRWLIDGAHNGPSVAATIAVAAAALRPGWRLVLGLAKDKEVDEVAAAIPAGLAVTRCGYRSPRARSEADWPERLRAWPWRESVTDALGSLQGGGAGDVCVTGSFYLAGEALAALGAQGELPG